MSTNPAPHPLYDLPIETITGEQTSLSPYRGKVLLIVNVASKCGLTPQYEGLEKLFAQYQADGLVVLGFPANDFAGQEPGDNAQIQDFCRATFGVNFPMHAKISVCGAGRNPLYEVLTRALPVATPATPVAGAPSFREQITGYLASIGLEPNAAPEVLWNFEKFLVDRKGNIIHRFSPEVLPSDPALVAAIEAALSA